MARTGKLCTPYMHSARSSFATAKPTKVIESEWRGAEIRAEQRRRSTAEALIRTEVKSLRSGVGTRTEANNAAAETEERHEAATRMDARNDAATNAASNSDAQNDAAAMDTTEASVVTERPIPPKTRSRSGAEKSKENSSHSFGQIVPTPTAEEATKAAGATETTYAATGATETTDAATGATETTVAATGAAETAAPMDTAVIRGADHGLRNRNSEGLHSVSPKSYHSVAHKPDAGQSMQLRSINNKSDAHLSNSHQSDAPLSDAHLSDAHLSNAHQSDAHQSNAHLSNTHQSDVRQPVAREWNEHESISRQSITRNSISQQLNNHHESNSHQSISQQPDTLRLMVHESNPQQSFDQQSNTRLAIPQQSTTHQSIIHGSNTRQSLSRQSVGRQSVSRQSFGRQSDSRQSVRRQSHTRQSIGHEIKSRQSIDRQRSSGMSTRPFLIEHSLENEGQPPIENEGHSFQQQPQLQQLQQLQQRISTSSLVSNTEELEGRGNLEVHPASLSSLTSRNNNDNNIMEIDDSVDRKSCLTQAPHPANNPSTDPLLKPATDPLLKPAMDCIPLRPSVSEAHSLGTTYPTEPWSLPTGCSSSTLARPNNNKNNNGNNEQQSTISNNHTTADVNLNATCRCQNGDAKLMQDTFTKIGPSPRPSGENKRTKGGAYNDEDDVSADVGYGYNHGWEGECPGESPWLWYRDAVWGCDEWEFNRDVERRRYAAYVAEYAAIHGYTGNDGLPKTKKLSVNGKITYRQGGGENQEVLQMDVQKSGENFVVTWKHPSGVHPSYLLVVYPPMGLEGGGGADCGPCVNDPECLCGSTPLFRRLIDGAAQEGKFPASILKRGKTYVIEVVTLDAKKEESLGSSLVSYET